MTHASFICQLGFQVSCPVGSCRGRSNQQPIRSVQRAAHHTSGWGGASGDSEVLPRELQHSYPHKAVHLREDVGDSRAPRERETLPVTFTDALSSVSRVCFFTSIHMSLLSVRRRLGLTHLPLPRGRAAMKLSVSHLTSTFFHSFLVRLYFP